LLPGMPATGIDLISATGVQATQLGVDVNAEIQRRVRFSCQYR